MLGSGDKASLLNVVIIGVVCVAATVVAVFLVDRLGRKLLIYQGDVQMVVCFIVVAVAMGVSTGHISNSSATLIIVFQCLFTAGFAGSWGCLGWLVSHPR